MTDIASKDTLPLLQHTTATTSGKPVTQICCPAAQKGHSGCSSPMFPMFLHDFGDDHNIDIYTATATYIGILIYLWIFTGSYI